MKKSGAVLLLFIIVIFSVSFTESIIQEHSIETWYPTLNIPSWTAPPEVFGPVWIVLYLLMAVSGWLLYLAPSSSKRTQALIWYGLQLALNLVWTLVFFGLHSIFLGLIDVIAIWLCVILTMYNAWPVNRLVTYLFIPNLLWITYAALINAAAWTLN